MAMKVWDPRDGHKIEWKEGVVLGVDPSMASTGWSILEFEPYRTPVLLDHGVIKTEPLRDEDGEMALTNMESNLRRMSQIHRDFAEILDEYYLYHCQEGRYSEAIDWSAMELPVPARMGALSLGGPMASVVISTSIVDEAIALGYVHPTHSKRVVSGRGKSTKAEVKKAVLTWLGGLDLKFNQDVSDSIAVSLCLALDMVDGVVELKNGEFQ